MLVMSDLGVVPVVFPRDSAIGLLRELDALSIERGSCLFLFREGLRRQLV